MTEFPKRSRERGTKNESNLKKFGDKFSRTFGPMEFFLDLLE
jgi:hypothetical protein